MITRPSTPQILNSIVEELTREVLPLLETTTSQIRLQMIMTVLGQCAGRAEQEIALMREEAAASTDYARRVADATGDVELQTAVDALEVGDDLRLPAITAEYVAASEALALALETALDAGLADLVADGERLLSQRIATEQSLTALVTSGR